MNKVSLVKVKKFDSVKSKEVISKTLWLFEDKVISKSFDKYFNGTEEINNPIIKDLDLKCLFKAVTNIKNIKEVSLKQYKITPRFGKSFEFYTCSDYQKLNDFKFIKTIEFKNLLDILKNKLYK